MQTQLLTEFPSEQLSIYAVWLQMLPSISKDKWDATIMPDARVKHFWDGELDAARWFAKQVDGYDGVSWDMYYLYGPGQYGKRSLRRLWILVAPFTGNAKP